MNMATLHLVTGYRGSAHITSADQGLFNAGCVGLGEYVFAWGKMFEAKIVTNNTVRISDGCLLMNGRQVNLDLGSYVDVNIGNGSQSMNRNDLIVVRYTKNQSTGIESVNLAVIQGTPSSGTAADPTYTTTNILNGDATHDMPLYRVKVTGLTIIGVEPLFRVLAPLADIQHNYYPRNLIVNSDFQCNQRKVTQIDTTDTGTYTLDMWRGFKIKLQVGDNGVKVGGQTSTTQGYFTQFVKVKTLAEKYTICVRVDGVNYSFTTPVTDTVAEQTFDKFKISVIYLSSQKHIKVNFCPYGTSFMTIGYIDLYEGGYAFPHVKEDYGVAIARCRPYVKCEKYICPITYSYTQGSTKSYKIAIPHGQMIDTPKVTISYWQYTDNAGQGVSGTHSGLLAMSNMADVSYARLPWSAEKQTDSFAVEANCLVTCEPDDA